MVEIAPTARFAARIDNGAFPAISAQIASVAAVSSAVLTTLFTSPILSASSAATRPSGKKQVLGRRGTDGTQKVPKASHRIGEAEFCRGQGENRRFGGDPQVAGKRDGKTPANAVAVDHGDDRQSRAPDTGERRFVMRLVSTGLSGVPPDERKLRNVGARGKGSLAGTSNHNDPDGVLCRQSVHRVRDAGPHGCGDGIAAIGPVEDKKSRISRHMGAQIGCLC